MNIIKRIIGIFSKVEVVEVKKTPVRYIKVYKQLSYEEIKALLQEEVSGLGVYFCSALGRIDPFGGEDIQSVEELNFHENRKVERPVIYVRYLGYFAEDNLPKDTGYIYKY